MAKLSALLFVLALAACSAAIDDDEITSGDQPAQNATRSLEGVRLSLAQGLPRLVVQSTNNTCSDGSTGCASAWLSMNWAKVWEESAAGGRVQGRSGAQVLDLTAAPSWQLAETLAGSPPVKLVTATLTLPLKTSVPQCGQPSATVATPNPRPSIVMEVLLFGGDTNYTVFGQPTEFLSGNVKSTISATYWPFCAPTNSLVLELGFRTSAIDAREARVKTGAEAEEERSRQVDEVAEAIGEPAVQAASAQGRGNDGGVEGSQGKRVGKGAVGKLDKLSPADRRSLEHRLVDQRAVLGLGRRGHDTQRRFIALAATSGSVDAKLDIPATALVDGALQTITVETPSKGNGLQRVLLRLPAFQTSLEYDPTSAFAVSDASVDSALQTSLDATGATDPTNSAPTSLCRLSALLAAMLALAALAVV